MIKAAKTRKAGSARASTFGGIVTPSCLAVLAFGTVLGVLCFNAAAQQTGKVRRIGMLVDGTVATSGHPFERMMLQKRQMKGAARLRSLEKYVSCGNLKLCEWRSNSWRLSPESHCQPVAICF